MGAKEVLTTALASGDPDAIAAAIAEAEGKPGVTSKDIDGAKKAMAEATTNKETIKVIKEAMAGQSIEAVKKAIETAR